MKKVFVLSLVFILSMVFATAALADTPAPGGPFSSAFNVQNVGTADTTCSFTMYKSDGTTEFTSTPKLVTVGSVYNVYVPNDTTAASGQYSVVVACDGPVAAVVNSSDTDSGASYSGINEPAQKWYAPGIYDNFYTYYSNVVVQNATAGTVDVTLNIYKPGQAAAVYTKTETAVPAYASVSFEQEGLAELVNNQFYSAVIEATGDVAAIVNIYGSGATAPEFYSYNCFKAGSTTAYAPLIMSDYYTYDTSLVIQNIDTAAATVTVTYTNGYTKNYTILPGAAESIYTPTEAGIPSGNTLYGATVVSTNAMDIVVLVNQSNPNRRAASYTGFAAGSKEVRAPIVEKNYYTYNSSVTCQNVGAAAATMTIAYAGVTGSTVSPAAVVVGGTYLFYQPGDPILATVPNNWLSSAVITSAEDIVCVINQDVKGELAGNIQDSLYSYNGVAP
jgi:hypothetical protein